MAKELEIPHDLAALESRLRTAAVSGSKINRDQLLYDAGWAAATAQHVVGNSAKHWAWPAATGVLATIAASLALLLFQQYGLNYRNGTAVGPAMAKRTASRSAEDTRIGQPANSLKTQIQLEGVPAREVEGSRQTDDSRNVAVGASTFRAIRERSIRTAWIGTERKSIRRIGGRRDLRMPLTSRLQIQDFDWEMAPRSDWAGSSPEYTSKTNFEATQELLRELLPDLEIENMSQSHIWRWFGQTWREVL